MKQASPIAANASACRASVGRSSASAVARVASRNAGRKPFSLISMPGVQKRRHQRSQAGRESRIARGGQAPGPEVDEHEREHAQADVDGLRQRVGGGLRLGHEPRRCDQHDVAEVGPGDRLASDVKRAVVSHASGQVAVDQLVDQDPRRDDPARKPELDDRRHRHQPDQCEERPAGPVTAYGLEALLGKLAPLRRLLNCQGRPRGSWRRPLQAQTAASAATPSASREL